MSSIEIHIPEALEPYAPQLRFFFDTMVMKLNINRHKGFAADRSFATLEKWLRGEVEELEKSLLHESQFEAAIECADVANFCFLMASRCLMLSKPAWEHEQKDQNL